MDDDDDFSIGETPRAPPQELTDDDVLNTYVTGGIVSTFQDAKTREEERSIKQIIRLVEGCKAVLLDKTTVARDSQTRLSAEEAKLAELEAQAAELQDEVQAVRADSRLLRVQKRRKLNALNDRLQGVRSQLDAQSDAVYKETQIRDLAVRERDAADMELHKLRDQLLLFRQVDSKLSHQDKVVSDYRAKQERLAVQREKRRIRQQKKLAQQVAAEVEQKADAMTRTALKLNTKAAKSVAKDRVRWKQQLEEGAKMANEAHKQRTNAILELKRATEKANSQLRGANERKKQRDTAIEARNKQEFDSILEDGGNPYEVFRRRQRDKDVARQRRTKIAKTKRTEAQIAARMIEEAKRERREAAQVRKNMEYEEVYQREMGRAAKEARVSRFVAARTKHGDDIIDPTGRTFRVEPSQVTTIKDHAFGLGRHATKRPDIVDKIRSKAANAGVTTDPRFLPKPVPAPQGSAGAAAAGGTNAAGGAGGLSAGAGGPGASKDRYVPRELSKLEKKLMKEARGRQRANIVKKQVVWGKEYKGRAYLSEPSVILFKDFTVGKPMRLRVVLTNVSYTFNSFKLLPLDDEIKDFFDFKFKPPGRMSAGMTCSIFVTFSPKVNQDIESELRLLCSTGPISIPVRCLTRKAVPVVSDPLVAIGNVVLGEARTRPLRIENAGALPVRIRVVRDVPVAPRDTGTGLEETKAKAAAAGSEGDGDDAGSVVIHSAESMAAAERKATGADDGVPQEEEDPTLKLVASDEPELTFQEEYTLEGYSKLSIPFTFRPQRPAEQSIGLRLEFDNPQCAPTPITVQARGLSVPIYVEKQVMDFKTCAFGKLYRMPLVLRNRGNIALKCLTQVPRGLRDGVLEFNPTMGFVQATDKATGEPGRFELQMKFQPTKALFKRLGKHADPETRRISVPIRVVAPDQVLPVIFTLTAKLTSSGLEFSPPTLDFGRCFTGQAASIPLSMTNTSDLPIKFGFVHLPPTVEVFPRDGFGVLLPQETLTRDVVYTPSAAVPDQFKISVRTTMNRDFRLPCTAMGVEPPLRLSYSRIKFRAMAVGEHEAHSIYVTNMSSKPQTFEFQVPYPELSQIKVSPCVETLEPGQQTRVEVEFRPRDDPTKSTPQSGEAEGKGGDGEGESEGDGADGGEGVGEGKEEKTGGDEDGKQGGGDGAGGGEEAGGAGEGKGDEEAVVTAQDVPPHIGRVQYSRAGTATGAEEHDGDEDLSTEPWSRHAMWKLPCFVRSVVESEAGDGGVSYSQALVVEVHTTTVRRTLVAEQERVEFGQLAVGQFEVFSLRVHNHGHRISRLKAKGLNPHGPFTVVNALRDVMPGEYQDITLQFRPTRQRKFVETLTVRSGIGSVHVILRGEGVSPTLQLQPESGLLDVGHVLQDNIGTATFQLTNTSVFPLNFSIKAKTQSYQNFTPRLVFSCSPSEATIPSGETQEVTVTFCPDHARRDEFVMAFLVDIPNQETETVVTVRGRCWDRQLFVLPTSRSDWLAADHPDLLENNVSVPVCMTEDVFSIAAMTMGVAGAGAAAGAGDEAAAPTPPPPYNVCLTFPKPGAGGYAESDVELTKDVIVGSCSPNDAKLGAAGSFDVVWDDDDPVVQAGIFSVDTAKGSLNGGNENTIKFTFKPPPVEDRAAGSGNSLGQWTSTTARIVLRGGFCSPGVPEEQSIPVVLKGFVPL